MTIAIDTSRRTAEARTDTVLIEKVRWSLRQRLRKQLHLLIEDFFDEVDDFLFSGGQQGQFSTDSIYLNAMRELRAKQAHFDSLFLDKVIDYIKRSYTQQADSASGAAGGETDIVFEQVEVDLALQAMARKAEKSFLPVIRQIVSIQDRLEASLGTRIISSRVLLDAVQDAFRQSHSVFNVPLEIRLVVIKLFERHFLLKLEKVFLDIVSIINNVSDPAFVDKLYSSSSAMRTRIANTRPGSNVTQLGQANDQMPRPEEVRTAAQGVVEGLCRKFSLPEFVQDMLRNQWREVLFLIGLNRGTGSVEWGEARHTAELLAATVSQQIGLAEAEQEALIGQLNQGFALIQLGQDRCEEFFLDIDQYLHGERPAPGASDVTAINAAPQRQNTSLEVSVSAAGAELLDQQDLDDIARMLGEEKTTSQQGQLSDYLRRVDGLEDGSHVDFKLNGDYARCILSRSKGNAQLFTISRHGSQVSVTRSRLGLALALQSGELRPLEEMADTAARQDTVFESSNSTRRN